MSTLSLRMPGMSWLTIAFLFSSGCSQTTKKAPSAGSSSFSFIQRPPAAGGAHAEPSQVPDESTSFTEAQLLDPFILPAYPAKLLGKYPFPVIVAVHIHVTPEGDVDTISPSNLGISTPVNDDDAFRSAVEVAVKQWRFKPAKRVRKHRDERGGLVSTAEAIDADSDLAFRFAPSGKVQPRP